MFLENRAIIQKLFLEELLIIVVYQLLGVENKMLAVLLGLAFPPEQTASELSLESLQKQHRNEGSLQLSPQPLLSLFVGGERGFLFEEF